MASFNKVILIGNLCKDAELQYTQKGTAIGKVSLAVNRKWKSDTGELKEEVTFIDVTAFGKTAEVIGQYCRKGNPLMVEGRLHMDTWEDKQTGQKRSKLCVVCEGIQLLGGGSKNADSQTATAAAGSPPNVANRTAQPQSKATTATDPGSGNINPTDVGDDDVPF